MSITPARHGMLLAFALAACGDGAAVRADARPRPDAAPPVDAGPPGDARLGVDCQGAGCDPDEVCCGERLVPSMLSTFCAPADAECDEVRFECDGPEDCAGGECCSLVDGPVRCVAAGTCDGFRICHVDAHCLPVERCCDTPVGVVRACQAAGCAP